MKNVRTLVFAASAIGLVIAAAPVHVLAQGDSRTITQRGPKAESPPKPTPEAPKPTPGGPPKPTGGTPPKPTTGTPSAAEAAICKDLNAKMQALSKDAKKDAAAAKSRPAECGNIGMALGVLRALRVITEVCSTGDRELDASLVKMFDNFVTLTQEILAKECQ